MGKDKYKWATITLSIVLVIIVIVCILVLWSKMQPFVADGLLNDYHKACIIGGIATGVALIFIAGTFIFQIITSIRQNKSGQIDRFETTFFNMLNLQQQIVNELSLEDTQTKDVYEGREVFHYAWEKAHIKDIEKPLNMTMIGMVDFVFKKGIAKFDKIDLTSNFDHYFRHLYRIVKFVDKNKVLTEKEKYEYIGILRSTLSRYELVWLYYNCLGEIGKKKFKGLVEKYCLLKNIRVELLSNDKMFVNKMDSLQISPEELKRNNFTGTCYEYYLSSEKYDKNKHSEEDKERLEKLYYLGAFYNQYDEKGKKKGNNLLTSWTDFIKRRTKALNSK